ncbi:MAG: pyridoxal-dependent decarboxylase, partial [Heyndrickxia sp.]
MNHYHEPTYLRPFDPYRPIQNNSYYSTPPEYQQKHFFSKPLYRSHSHPHAPTKSGHSSSNAQIQILHNALNVPFTRNREPLPHYRLPNQGMLSNTAYENIHNEIAQDGNPQLNLATFVTTWMEPTANRLYAEAFDKNLIDKDEYPKTAGIEERCIRILANLWHAPHPHTTMGVSTTASSEGCMLGGLALKRRWQIDRKRQGKPMDRPNIVLSSAVQ